MISSDLVSYNLKCNLLTFGEDVGTTEVFLLGFIVVVGFVGFSCFVCFNKRSLF